MLSLLEAHQLQPFTQNILQARIMLPAVVAAENWIYVFGGEDEPRHRSRRVYRIALSSLLE